MSSTSSSNSSCLQGRCINPWMRVSIKRIRVVCREISSRLGSTSVSTGKDRENATGRMLTCRFTSGRLFIPACAIG